MKQIGLAVIGLLATCQLASAQPVLYQQAWPGMLVGATSLVSLPKTADDFLPTAAWTITEVRWTGIWSDSITVGATRPFVVSFYADSAGQPAVTPFLSYSVVANGSFNSAIPDMQAFDFSALLPPNANVPSGSPVWIAIQDDGANASDSAGMFWGIGPPGNLAQDSGGGWEIFDLSGISTSFTLLGSPAVPSLNPLGIAMLCTLLGLAGLRRLRG